jgi:hypothetical protein
LTDPLLDKQDRSLAPGRAARRWMTVTNRGRSVPAEKIAAPLRINPEFTQKVYDTIYLFAADGRRCNAVANIEPGTTVIITDQPVVRSRGKAAILEG